MTGPRRTALLLIAIIAIAALNIFAGCDAADDDAGAVAQIRLPAEIPPELEYLVLLVSGPDMQDIERRVDLAGAEEPVVVSIEVPAGDDRSFAASAFGADDILFYRGESTTDIEAGSEIEVTITMAAMAHVKGTIFAPGVNEYPGEPLADFDFDGDQDHPPIHTDSEGNYFSTVPVGSYTFLVETPQAHAQVPVELSIAGEIQEMNIYLDLDANEYPYLFAIVPQAGMIGDTITLYGEGFTAGLSPPEVVFGDKNPIIVPALEYCDSYIIASVPFDVPEGVIWIQTQQISELGIEYSKFIDFEILEPL